ncbi:MAG: hypothetical protein EXS08_16650 [Planctomycetes bacterium]|nr:hypothetical protein [Planctomycetota bacterium]
MSMSPARLAFLSLPLCLLSAQCASNRSAHSARLADDSQTYRGLTLEEWIDIPWSGSGEIDNGNGELTFERDVERTIEALRAFANDSEAALARLQQLSADRDEDVRESSADALVELALSPERTHAAAMDSLMALIADEDPRTCSAALGQLIGDLDSEDADWSRLGAGREAILVSRVEFLLGAPGDDEMSTALYAIEILGPRSAEYEQEFRAFLAQPVERYRSPDAADALNDFAWERVAPDTDVARQESLAVLAAQAATALAPKDPDYLRTLAFAHWRLGQRKEALSASRRALDLATSQHEKEGGRQKLLEMLSLEASWPANSPSQPR